MNLPNKLTVLRVLLVPVFIALFYYGQYFLANAVFVAASLTDMLDGKIARSRNLITNFGKLMDPLADKILTTSAFVCFVAESVMPAWMLIVILAREFAVTGLRGVAAAEGKVIAADMTGKIKTVLQMAAIIVILAALAIPGFNYAWAVWFAGRGVLWAAVAMTIISGVQYLWKGREFLDMK
ncbi:MAG: CDP-diacylglycerol--glycerol-3-phosphate 3-phosphatidyltransferase [Clostridiales Family XIII bacterium]|jgi:CDP-diacylglycerol--glycerol-3-phosphate 3-phosphatidyltransferase/cardiolipin synthase|nr:CDP-diacylglycerol--glycerol-3-phosphate 3-phosphatidyltransferase [Clostridiales Family XIII bacterium]